MKTLPRSLTFVLAAMLFTSCSPKLTPTPPVFQYDNPYAPQASDSDLMAGDITIDSTSVFLSKSWPP